MTQQKKQLKDITSGIANKWRKEVVDSQKNRSAIRKANKFVLLVLDYMDSHNIKQKELATKCEVSPQQVNKWLKGGTNISLETICKIEDALGIDIFMPQMKVRSTILESETKSVTKTFQKSSLPKKNQLKTMAIVYKRASVLITDQESIKPYEDFQEAQ